MYYALPKNTTPWPLNQHFAQKWLLTTLRHVADKHFHKFTIVIFEVLTVNSQLFSRVVQQRQTEETNPATGQVDPSLKENLEHLKTNSSSGDDVNVNAKDNEPQDIPDVGQPIKETKDGLEADIDEKTGADDIVDDEFSTDKSEPSINKREHISLKSNLSPYDEFYSLWRQFNIDLTCKVYRRRHHIISAHMFQTIFFQGHIFKRLAR